MPNTSTTGKCAKVMEFYHYFSNAFLALMPASMAFLTVGLFQFICENAGFRFLQYDEYTISIPYHDITGEFSKKQLTEYF
jgi:hypothetical protein